MLRFAAIFVVICMVLIAAALGIVLYLAFGLTGSEATIVSLAALTALALYNAVTTRLRDRANLGDQVADLSRGTGDLARQVAEQSRRLAVLEGRNESSADTARGALAPISAELGELGTMMKQLAETVAAHEAQLAAVATAPAPYAEPAAMAPAAVAAAPAEPEVLSGGVKREELLLAIRSAVDAHRVDMHLQPIVTLPQRKVRYYEALSRLRTEDGHMLPPAEFLEPAETNGLLGRIDNLLLFRCVQVLRRLLVKNREIGLFCNISAQTLNDPQFFPQMVQFMEANRVLAPALMLEFKQSAWRDMGPLETESLAALRQLGFRFCMDQCTDLRFDPQDLAERGVRFVKAPAALLLGRTEVPGAADIHAADVSDMLHRYGISLIADKIESEVQVVDLLDYELKFGQGFLFSPPRPVRAEALQGIVTEAVGRDGGSAEPPRAAAS